MISQIAIFIGICGKIFREATKELIFLAGKKFVANNKPDLIWFYMIHHLRYKEIIVYSTFV